MTQIPYSGLKPTAPSTLLDEMDMANPVDLYSVELLEPHTHAGRACVAGDCIEVNATEHEFLLKRNKIKELHDKTKAKTNKAVIATAPTIAATAADEELKNA